MAKDPKDKDTNYSAIPRYGSSYSLKPNKSPYERPMSIFDAYNEGAFGRSKIDEGLEEGSDEWNKQNEEVQRAKNSRDYMVVDALSKGLSGLGKTVSNVGAAFTGGTMQDATPEQSLWQARNNELIKQGISAEEKNIGGSDAAFNAAQAEADIQGKYKDLSSKEMALEMDNMKLIMPREYRQLYENADQITNPILRSAVRGSAAVMLNKYVNGGEVKAPDIIASIIANGGNELAKEAEKNNMPVEAYVMKEVMAFAGPLIDKMGNTINVNADFGNMFGNKDKQGANTHQADAAYSGLTDRGNNVDEKTYNEIMNKYGLTDTGDLEQLRQDAYRKIAGTNPKLWNEVNTLLTMSPAQRNAYAYDHQLDNPLMKNGLQKEAMNIARILGGDVSFQRYQDERQSYK